MSRFITAVLLLCTLAIAERVVAQDVKFTSPVTYPAGSPYVVTSGDFNGDGKQDLVAGDVQHNDLTWQRRRHP